MSPAQRVARTENSGLLLKIKEYRGMGVGCQWGMHPTYWGSSVDDTGSFVMNGDPGEVS
jgi:hypothetical protein